MAQAVIDPLEVVEIQEQQSDPFIPSRAADQRLLEAIMEQRAIWQASQRIIEGLVLEFPLEQLAPMNVMDRCQDGADGRLVQQAREVQFDVTPISHPVLEPQLDVSCGPGSADHLRPQCLQHDVLIAMDKVHEVAIQQTGRRIVPGRFGGRALIGDHAIGRARQDQIGGVLDKRTKVLLIAAGGGRLARRRLPHLRLIRAQHVPEEHHQPKTNGEHERRRHQHIRLQTGQSLHVAPRADVAGGSGAEDPHLDRVEGRVGLVFVYLPVAREVPGIDGREHAVDRGKISLVADQHGIDQRGVPLAAEHSRTCQPRHHVLGRLVVPGPDLGARLETIFALQRFFRRHVVTGCLVGIAQPGRIFRRCTIFVRGDGAHYGGARQGHQHRDQAERGQVPDVVVATDAAQQNTDADNALAAIACRSDGEYRCHKETCSRADHRYWKPLVENC